MILDCKHANKIELSYWPDFCVEGEEGEKGDEEKEEGAKGEGDPEKAEGTTEGEEGKKKSSKLIGNLKEKCQGPIAFLSKKAASAKEKDPEAGGAEEDEAKELLEGDAKEKKEGEGEGGAEGEEEGKEKAEESGSKDWGLMSYLRNAAPSLFNKKTPTEGEAKDEGELKEVKVEGGDDSNKQVHGHWHMFYSIFKTCWCNAKWDTLLWPA